MIRRMQAWSQDPGRDWCGACLCGDHHQCQGSFDAMETHEPRPCLCTHSDGDGRASQS